MIFLRHHIPQVKSASKLSASSPAKTYFLEYISNILLRRAKRSQSVFLPLKRIQQSRTRFGRKFRIGEGHSSATITLLNISCFNLKINLTNEVRNAILHQKLRLRHVHIHRFLVEQFDNSLKSTMSPSVIVKNFHQKEMTYLCPPNPCELVQNFQS